MPHFTKEIAPLWLKSGHIFGKESVFGTISWWYFRIEFQERGAAHMHFLLKTEDYNRLFDN